MEQTVQTERASRHHRCCAKSGVARAPDLRAQRRRQIWNAMRQLPHFQIAEIALSASTDSIDVSLGVARAYVGALLRHGMILDLRDRGAKARAATGVYRLKPSANTGPIAPRCLRNRTAIFDPNRNEIWRDGERRPARPDETPRITGRAS